MAMRGMTALSTQLTGEFGALDESAVGVAAWLAARRAGGGAVRGMAALGAQLFGELRTFGKGAVGVAVRVGA